MRWIIAENKNSCAVMVFDLVQNGQKINNSFDSLKACDKVLQALNNPLYFPLLLVDSGISIDKYFKKYPLQDTPKPQKRGINRVAPPMKIKEVKETKPTAKKEVKPVVKAEPKPIKKEVKTAVKTEPKQENKQPVKKESKPVAKIRVDRTSKPKPQPKQENKRPVKTVKSAKRFTMPKIKDTRKIAALLTSLVACLFIVLIVNSCHINKPLSVEPVQPVVKVQPTPKKEVKPVVKAENKPTVKAETKKVSKPVQRVAPAKVVINTPKDIKQVFKGDKKVYKANKLLLKAQNSTNPVKAARLQKRADKKLNKAAKKYSKANS